MRKGATIKKAIIEVLKKENRPLRVNEIYRGIIEDDLYRFKAENPEHVVRTLLRRHSENLDFPSANKTKHFVFLTDGTYWIKGIPNLNLSKKEEKKVPNESSQYEMLQGLHRIYLANFKKTILKQLGEIDPTDFEHFCRHLLTAYGFKNMKVTRKSKDGGIDGYGELKIGLATMPVAFECKRWSSTVGRPKVSQFRGDIQGKFQQGVFFTTSKFSMDAKKISFQPGAVPIVLIDGNGIVDLMIEKEFGIEKEELPIYTNAVDLVLQNQ
jgi:restriction system protein